MVLVMVLGMVLVMVSVICGFLSTGSRTDKPDTSRFLSETHSITSPSGEFIAEQENFIGDNNTRLYVVHINDSEGNRVHTCQILLRMRDNNFVLWADDEDTLWIYSGDLGTFCWKHSGESWTQFSSVGGSSNIPYGYIDENGEVQSIELAAVAVDRFTVPEDLLKARGKNFNGNTVKMYALPDDYNNGFFTIYGEAE
jgi:hypothetical protein